MTSNPMLREIEEWTGHKPPPGPRFPWIRILLTMVVGLIIAVALSGCASTVLYRDGKRIARFDGDMTGVRYAHRADGSCELTGETIDHSSATLAQGQAASNKIAAAGVAVAASGLTYLLK